MKAWQQIQVDWERKGGLGERWREGLHAPRFARRRREVLLPLRGGGNATGPALYAVTLFCIKCLLKPNVKWPARCRCGNNTSSSKVSVVHTVLPSTVLMLYSCSTHTALTLYTLLILYSYSTHTVPGYSYSTYVLLTLYSHSSQLMRRSLVAQFETNSGGEYADWYDSTPDDKNTWTLSVATPIEHESQPLILTKLFLISRAGQGCCGMFRYGGTTLLTPDEWQERFGYHRMADEPALQYAARWYVTIQNSFYYWGASLGAPGAPGGIVKGDTGVVRLLNVRVYEQRQSLPLFPRNVRRTLLGLGLPALPCPATGLGGPLLASPRLAARAAEPKRGGPGLPIYRQLGEASSRAALASPGYLYLPSLI
jgi:hypothetical protein